MSHKKIIDIIKESYHNFGFDDMGYVPYQKLDSEVEYLRQWINSGYAGDMEYLQRSLEIRGDIRNILPNAQSVVVLIRGYRPSPPPIDPDIPIIASYAQMEDYHLSIRRDINSLLKTIQQSYPDLNGRAVTDSAPTFDREWAKIAGLGYCGRSSLLIHPRLGSYILIGLLVLDQDLDIDYESCTTNIENTTKNRCGECRECIDACPSNAILGNGHINANLCIAYQTNTKSGAPDTYTHNYIFGCDECLKACPHNRDALAHRVILNYDSCSELSNHASSSLASDNNKTNFELTIQQWMNMSKSEFKTKFSHTPLGHLGHKRIIKNVEHFTALKKSDVQDI